MRDLNTTEDWRTEEILQRHKMLFDTSRDTILFVRRDDGRILEANPSAEAAYGYTRDELLKLTAMDLRAPESMGSLDAQMAEADNRGILFETVHTRKDGTTFPVEVNSRGVMVNGTRTLISIIRDITERKRTEEALKASEHRYRTIFENTQEVFYKVDPQGMIVDISPSCQRYSGYTPEEFIGKHVLSFYHNAGDGQAFLKAIREKGEVTDYETLVKSKDGRALYVSANARLVPGPTENEFGVEGMLRDVTERKQQEKALQYETAFLDAVINCSQEGIILLDVERQKVIENQRARDLWKIVDDVHDDEDAVLHMIRSLKDAGSFREKLAHLFEHPQDSIQLELELKDGTVLDSHTSPINGKDGKNFGRLWTFKDITELRRYARNLENLSGTDALTSLANRRRFDEVLEREWRRAIRNGSSISLIMIDIDFFKAYNDRYGHLMGDECLRLVGSAIARAVQRPTDLSARYGGEEFACILPDTDLKAAIVVARKTLASVRALDIPHLSSSVTGHVTVSIGAATLIPGEDESVSHLIESADRSLYQAKQGGRNRIQSSGREA
jgi:diguanylate cyclase (GGDEF)-like protein/PAS domain S-box-containing protein